jgi:uncharacterized membrane protein
VADYQPTAQNIRAIVELEREVRRGSSRGERIGQAITDHIGTVQFVVWHMMAVAAWMAWNLAAPDAVRFDPYPFGLLTFIVSLEGVLIATFVLIAQNRMSRQTDQRNHLNLQISMLAEQELTLLLKLVRQIAERVEVRPESEDQAKAETLAAETNVYQVVDELRRELDAPDKKTDDPPLQP